MKQTVAFLGVLVAAKKEAALSFNLPNNGRPILRGFDLEFETAITT